MAKTFIIAEAGVNHNGNKEIAKELIIKAKEVGADAIKFQTFIAKELVTDEAKTAIYQENNMGAKSQLHMLKDLELSFDNFVELKTFAMEAGIEFLSTPFDFQSIEFLKNLSLSRMKIPSGEITDKPYLQKIAELGLPVILSTGMSTMEEISDALNVFESYPPNMLTLLHCTTEYPAPFEEINLNAIITLKEVFGYPVGYSDHTSGIEASIAAVALGAVVIEKHFTLDKAMIGPDHKASMMPSEFKMLVHAIRNIEKSLGDGKKVPSVSERKNISLVRKSIVASRNIEKGEIFSEENLGVKRPGDGISPMKWDKIIGLTSTKSYRKDEKIKL